MPLTAVTIRGYRSVRNLFLPVEACSVFVGEFRDDEEDDVVEDS